MLTSAVLLLSSLLRFRDISLAISSSPIEIIFAKSISSGGARTEVEVFGSLLGLALQTIKNDMKLSWHIFKLQKAILFKNNKCQTYRKSVTEVMGVTQKFNSIL